jgi:transcriptional regulator with XRE-family HTH domain
MSDLYLVLRNRLEAVAEWVGIEPQVLRAARERRGLSYETMAREVHVSAKTWERYEKAGRVPRHALRVIAGVLELEIEEPAMAPVIIAGSDGERSEILERLAAMEGRLTSIDAKLSLLVPVEQLEDLEARQGEAAAALELLDPSSSAGAPSRRA